jgi:5-(carboxyamino)imidazole ribonucleotide mutase
MTIPEHEMIGIGVLLGSGSDIPAMQPCFDILKGFEVPFKAGIASAHRTPEDVDEFVNECIRKGCLVFIAAAGLSAQLPGAIASKTVLPVIGVPLASTKSLTAINGLDSLLSIVQMPKGIPVGTVGIGAAENAAYLALQILGTFDGELREALIEERKKKADEVRKSNEKLKDI